MPCCTCRTGGLVCPVRQRPTERGDSRSSFLPHHHRAIQEPGTAPTGDRRGPRRPLWFHKVNGRDGKREECEDDEKSEFHLISRTMETGTWPTPLSRFACIIRLHQVARDPSFVVDGPTRFSSRLARHAVWSTDRWGWDRPKPDIRTLPRNESLSVEYGHDDSRGVLSFAHHRIQFVPVPTVRSRPMHRLFRPGLNVHDERKLCVRFTNARFADVLSQGCTVRMLERLGRRGRDRGLDVEGRYRGWPCGFRGETRYENRPQETRAQ